jgi:pimeloyl-ACP methyl ester carboxylesterase
MISPVPYGPADTCQDINSSEARLRDYLLAIRSDALYSVSLVGHSLGGVIALETVIRYPELRPMVRSIVTVDSPLLGVSAFREGLWLSYVGLSRCDSMDAMVPRHRVRPATLEWLRAGTQQLLDRGISVRTIVNDADSFYIGVLGDQGIDGVNVNVEGAWYGSGANHDAVLNTPDGISTILGSIQT